MKFGHLAGVPQPYLGDLLTVVINHLLTGMILQVLPFHGGFLSLDIPESKDTPPPMIPRPPKDKALLRDHSG